MNKSSGDKLASSGIMTLAVLWAIAGLVAFIMSVYCMAAYPSTTAADWTGVALAILLGPLYWIYYAYKGGYCTARAVTLA